MQPVNIYNTLSVQHLLMFVIHHSMTQQKSNSRKLFKTLMIMLMNFALHKLRFTIDAYLNYGL